jgi:hypothetical protein
MKPRLDPDEPEYPTDEQMTTMFNAWKKDGKAGILGGLRAMHLDKEAPEPKSTQKADGKE